MVRSCSFGGPGGRRGALSLCRNYAHGSIPANSSCGSCRVLSFVFKLRPQSLYMPRVQNLAPLDVKSLTCMSESLWENSGRGNQIHNGTLAVYGMAPGDSVRRN